MSEHLPEPDSPSKLKRWLVIVAVVAAMIVMNFGYRDQRRTSYCFCSLERTEKAVHLWSWLLSDTVNLTPHAQVVVTPSHVHEWHLTKVDTRYGLILSWRTSKTFDG